MHTKSLLAAGLALLFALNSEAPIRAADPVTLIQADGEEVSGELKELSASGVTVDSRTFASREIAQLKFHAATAPAAAVAPSVILRNQDVVAQAAIVSGSDTAVTLKTSWFESIDLDYKVIDAIVFYAMTKKMPDALDALLKSPPPKEDALLTMKGETILGFYEKLSDKAITFNAGGQSKSYPFDQIAAVRLAATEKFEASKTLNATLALTDGTRLTVKPIAVDAGFVKVEALDGKTWRVKMSVAVSLEFSGGRMVFLSALTPKAVDQKPYVGGAPVVFGWRKDRSAANGPLKIGETVYDKGLGVHSYCKLTYDLNGEYVKFISDVGMDASAPDKAECAWKLILDGKESVAGTAKAGAEKRVIRVDVTGAKVLELVCDFGPDDDDAGDRLDFAKARLIKP